ncbi:MAG: UDP-N-acetylmuramoyl-L-alanine--D-glutamate ligase [Enterobacteriaceae bacterium]
MARYQGRKVVIVGLGLTGRSCVDFFIARGVLPRVMDTRATLDVSYLPAGVECHLGGLNEQWLLEADLLVVSPGMALSTPILQRAAQAGIEIVGDIELFCREADAPIIAITGSNGKSTVTTLVGEMASAAGWQVGVGGNIGQPALTLLNTPCQLYVLELSSFQLETTQSLRAAAATVLNISEDHMDRYPQGLAQYQQAKLKIYHGACCAVFNDEDALTRPPAEQGQRTLSFGLSTGEYHLASAEGTEWLCCGQEKLLETCKLKLVGRHNALNGLAALALVDAVGVPRPASLQALQTFAGLDHRFQLAWEHNGVRWINDSKSTNVGSTLAALSGLKVAGVLHLLLGGDGKGADFSPLQACLGGERIRLYCFGRDGDKLMALRPQVALRTETLQQAMEQIASQVNPGDLVLLSPACASLDQFRNYEQRGHEFTRLAQELG